MTSKMSDKEIEKFIDASEQKDCLWRTTSPEYSDRNVRLKAASKIWRGDVGCFSCQLLRHVAGVDRRGFTLRR